MRALGMAIRIAAQVHEGQTDKAGADYILHPLAVMQLVAPEREAMIVAVLHDTIEDFTGSSLDKLGFTHMLEVTFSPTVLAALWCLTHRKDEPYADYIERVAQNYLARVVKIADLTHNMDPRRIPAAQIVDKDFARWDKYRRALIRLERD